ncbi:acyltransferase family protein [Microbacterium sp. NPDC056569]|uniref:acyltransferase family protein n=1 Tax=Microbacterium sp. NPDC056569 TaxID=3345867 RepID=UPI00366CE2FA
MTAVRPEIQALRALAVLGVLVFHLWPLRLPGGYVGVDVFFVVSGFLITDHLLREQARTGRISLPKFWARRARRLLPASLLVLVVTTLAVWLWVPDTRWSQFGAEIIASAFYVENWALAAQSVDYMALSNVKSPVQHFWSLGVEEQFYLVWPFLVLAGVAIAALRRARAEVLIAGVIGLATVASLVFSISSTAVEPSIAYFSTFTRAWEFGLGALLALLLRRVAVPLRTLPAALASWVGFAMIAVSMLLYTASTPFPSFTALLPAVGTALVIAAGSPKSVIAPTGLFSIRPVQFVGDVSYGAYLWHWPLVVLLPYALGAPIGTFAAAAILIASIVLGWLSKRFIEDPVRAHALVAHTRARWTFLATLIAMLMVAACALPLALHRITPPTPTSTQESVCYGAEAMPDSSCGPVEDVPLVASLSSFAIDLPPDDIRACERSTASDDFARCDFGDRAAAGPHVALIGDSHATRFVEPLRSAVAAADGVLSTYLVSGCAVMSRELTGSAWGFDPAYAEQCLDKSVRMHDAVAADPDIDVVVLMNRTRLYVSDDPSVHPLTQAQVEESIRRLQDAGKLVVVLKDPPEMSAVPPQQGESAVDCLTRSATPSQCSLPRTAAVFDDPMAAAALATGATLIDLDDAFCDAERCMSRIGGVVVYTDDNHVTRSFARSLTELLDSRLAPVL